ncbi:hypothetical protein QTO34_017235 [Cnephaeus nilssonii]|uniref:Helicase C-terminal domain-containing protein n=1 Tax=Cnephaeus nilssonii TaxID=3371016 RepID=A0AA40I0R0_CNENI|nr:hypothetical protein QTO34_017235 [Eptesicus nilssonii]
MEVGNSRSKCHYVWFLLRPLWLADSPLLFFHLVIPLHHGNWVSTGTIPKRENSVYNLGLIEQQLKMITDCVALVFCFPCLSIVCICSPCLIGGWNQKPKDLKGGPGLFSGSQCNLEQELVSAVALFERQISTELGSGRLAVQCSLVGEAASHPAAPRAVSFSPAHYAKAAPSDRGPWSPGARPLQWVSCAHVYSALDQRPARSTGKFTHGKCSTLIVTDLAARGLDIPLLDNVINFSFLAKGKLFLYSWLCSRLDVCWAGCRRVVDNEDCGLQNTLEASLQLWGLGRVAGNAQQQYVCLQLVPSPESIKQAKELDLVGQGLHALFSLSFEEEELQRLRLVDSIKQYRSWAPSLRSMPPDRT